MEDMNVANLEMCKELYELSGWGFDDSYTYWIVTPNATGTMERRNARDFDDRIPAYDLGYLLRKLPKHHNFGMPYVSQANDGTQWVASYINWWALWEYDGKGSAKKWHHEVTASLHFLADTPEDAACKLAIELFKQGILSKEII